MHTGVKLLFGGLLIMIITVLGIYITIGTLKILNPPTHLVFPMREYPVLQEQV